MERLTNKSPCLNCNSDRQIGNPNVWQTDCYRCEKMPNWKSMVIDRLSKIEDVLGDNYNLDRLRKLVEADKDGRLIIPPAGARETVYHITTCMGFSAVYDGTLYGDDGGPGTATGLYCPCELAENCPFSLDEDGSFDCEKHKNELAVFEDTVFGFYIDDGTIESVMLKYSGSVNFGDFGKTVFKTREAAESALKARKRGKKMTVLEMFYNCRVRSPLKVMSGYNSKILCQKFIPDKHLEIGKREVIAVWADIAVTKAAFGNYAQPIMCVFVDGSEECEKEQRKKKASENDV